jgi:hypothetical protein
MENQRREPSGYFKTKGARTLLLIYGSVTVAVLIILCVVLILRG